MDTLSEKSLKSIPRTSILEATADMALLLDGDGTILDVQVTSPDLNESVVQSWRGKKWLDTVSVESRPKINDLLAPNENPDQWRQVNHPIGGSDIDLPVRYRTFKLGRSNHLLGLGRDLTPIARLQQQLISAQQAAEHDYWQLRQAESKYRLLFHSAKEAVLVVDAERGNIFEANRAALGLLKWDQTPDSRTLWSVFSGASEAEVRGLLNNASAQGQATAKGLLLKESSAQVSASAALLRQGNSAIHIVHLDTGDSELTLQKPASSRLAQYFDAMPDGFVITDPAGLIRYANPSFADLAQLANTEQALGAPLSNWVGRSGVDLSVIMSNLQKDIRVRNFQSQITGNHELQADVEISAATITQAGEADSIGFVIRDSGQPAAPLGSDGATSRSVQELTELVGRVPLKELVRESADLIERLSIEAALQLTGNNRAAAADMLGLSRQSLYVKMRRYDIAEKRSDSH
ncbi:MAG: transcriptional regulator PpsR [Pseudomonadales bacterium]